MHKNELIKTLISADEDASLVIKTQEKIKVIIAGGSALIMHNVIQRQTMDIDTIGLNAELELVFNELGINSRMNAFSDSLAECYEDRLEKIDISTNVIDYYMLSLEDLVIMKLFSDRGKDYKDITNKQLLEKLDWNKLDQIIQSGEADVSFNQDRYKRFLKKYEDYKKEF